METAQQGVRDVRGDRRHAEQPTASRRSNAVSGFATPATELRRHAIAIPSPSAARMRHEIWPCMQARCGASDVALRLHRQPDLAAERCMSAAINELYEPSSSPDDIEAWELVKDLAARSTFI